MSYLLVLGPFSESALGKSPYFSRPNRSLIDTFKGRTEIKSRAVSLLATVAMIALSATFILIFRFVVLSVEASLSLLWPTASGLIASRSSLKTKVLVALMGADSYLVPFGRRSVLIARRSSIAR